MRFVASFSTSMFIEEVFGDRPELIDSPQLSRIRIGNLKVCYQNYVVVGNISESCVNKSLDLNLVINSIISTQLPLSFFNQISTSIYFLIQYW